MLNGQNHAGNERSDLIILIYTQSGELIVYTPTGFDPSPPGYLLVYMIPLVLSFIVLHVATSALRCPLAVAAVAVQALMLFLQCMTGRAPLWNFQHLVIQFAMQKQLITTYLDIPQW